jgi:hypothetical protein
MADKLVIYAISLSGTLLEAALLVVLLRRGAGKRLWGLTAYVAAVLGTGLARIGVLSAYGIASLAYAYFYWLSDVGLALGAFLLVCAFFRRACSRQADLWQHIRLFLAFVFVLVLGVSLFTLSRNYASLFTIFIIEFEQNLYFTCLILVSLLYILMQQFESSDRELSLLVCGLGIQFAGPAANFALAHLTTGDFYSASLLKFIPPLCTLIMLAIWTYAVTTVREVSRQPAALARAEAEMAADEA